MRCILFGALSLFTFHHVNAAPAEIVQQAPVSIHEIEPNLFMVDFGRVAFGNVSLASDHEVTVTVHFGEAITAEGRIDRKPPGTVRYQQIQSVLSAGQSRVVFPEKDRRNTRIDHATNPPAILTPAEWGVILPFRWVEIEGWKGELKPEHIVRQAAFASSWNDDAAAFECSDDYLNRIWDLCRYSIKATTFAGVYVDGDRERIPYEADAYLNQLSHYYTDDDKEVARDTIDHLFKHGTWPSEWAPHMVFMVHADYLWTGDLNWLASRYELLKSKTLADRRGEDGLISSNSKQIKRTDIVDWPKGERDDYVFTERNTVVNAFHLRAVQLMAELARALGKNDEAEVYESEYQKSYVAFQEQFFDSDTGLYRDGVETDHHSLHANLFPLAFGLVPTEHCSKIADWLSQRGMRCSVYAAQYLLEGLFENNAAEPAIDLILAENDRSWRHMLDSGTTITWEAWDQKYKPNQDWNHAWGAAPANLLPRYILGVEPLAPGWEAVRIRPNLANLEFAKGTVPTPKGPIQIEWMNLDGFKLSLMMPEGVSAQIELPMSGTASEVYLDGKAVSAEQRGERWVLDLERRRTVDLEVR